MAANVTLPEGFVLDQQNTTLPEGFVLDQQTPQQTSKQTSTALGNLMAPIAGANKTLPQVLGLPVDTATNLYNLGTAGIGQLMSIFGVDPSKLPNTIDKSKQMGGSAWMQNKLAQGMGEYDKEMNAITGSNKPLSGNPFSIQNPNSNLQQNLAMGGNIMGYGLMNPAQSIPETVANIGKMLPSAIGAITGKELFPNNPYAPSIGMLAAPATLSAAKAAVTSSTVPNQIAIKMTQLGYKLLPKSIRDTKTQDFIQGTAGAVPTKQLASVYNQKITNDLIKKDIGYPADQPITLDGLDALRAQAGSVYEKAKTFGQLKTDAAFKKDLVSISNKGSALVKEFPGLAKKDITDLVQQFNRSGMSSEAAVEAIKQLRADSNAGYNSMDPSISGLARAKGKLANSLESLMERNIKNSDPNYLNDFRAARQQIAKTYTVQNALKGENVDAIALGRQLDKGKPLSGNMRNVAEFGQKFKEVAQVNPPQQSNFRPMDLAAGVLGGAYNSKLVSAIFARPALRAIVLSGKYQNALAKAPPDKLQSILKLPTNAQALALTNLLTSQDVQTPTNLPQ